MVVSFAQNNYDGLISEKNSPKNSMFDFQNQPIITKAGNTYNAIYLSLE